MEVFSGKCRKHQSSNKQPGICSVCLRDRLLQLADAYNHNTTFHNNAVSVSVSVSVSVDDRCVSFSSTSTSSSPPIYTKSPPLMSNKKKHVRHASSCDVVRSISYDVIGEGGELKKSRSIATTMMDAGRSSAKRGSFWKKLLKVRGVSSSSSSSVKDQMQAVLGKSRALKDGFDD